MTDPDPDLEIFATVNPMRLRANELTEVLTALASVTRSIIAGVAPDGTISYGRKPATNPLGAKRKVDALTDHARSVAENTA